MDPVTFEWDPQKAAANLVNHGVSFDQAVSVFANPLARILPDPDHSEQEIREIIVGHSAQNRLLLVSFTERRNGIRIISARRATRQEGRDYEENSQT